MNPTVPVGNPQADIVVGLGCNAACGFCVQEITRKMVPNRDWQSLLYRSVGHVHQLGIRRFVITGGEPTMRGYVPRTLEALGVLGTFPNIEFRALYTNGAGLLTDNLSWRLAQAGLTHVNLSCHHHDAARDNQVFGIERPLVPTMTAAALDQGIKVRLNCSMLRGGIDTFDELLAYLEFAMKLGAQSVYFRELFEFQASEFYNPERDDTRGVLRYTQTKRFDIMPIVDQAQSHPDFALVSDWHEKNAGQGSQISFVYAGKLPVAFGKLVIGREAPGKRTYWVVMPNGLLYDAFTSEEQRVEV
jgi:molybdenum cofactor biosynthesis enzyme MoaA